MPVQRLGVFLITLLWANLTGSLPVPAIVLPHPANPNLKQIERLAGPYAKLVNKVALAEKVDPLLVAAVVNVENGNNFKGSTTRVSPTGAIGVMQLEPITAKQLHVNPWSPYQNILGGTKLLRYLLNRYHGRYLPALEAYNAGPLHRKCPQAFHYALAVIKTMRA